MTPSEKIIYYVRAELSEKHGTTFTELDEETQNEMIALTIKDYLKKIKSENKKS